MRVSGPAAVIPSLSHRQRDRRRVYYGVQAGAGGGAVEVGSARCADLGAPPNLGHGTRGAAPPCFVHRTPARAVLGRPVLGRIGTVLLAAPEPAQTDASSSTPRVVRPLSGRRSSAASLGLREALPRHRRGGGGAEPHDTLAAAELGEATLTRSAHLGRRRRRAAGWLLARRRSRPQCREVRRPTRRCFVGRFDVARASRAIRRTLLAGARRHARRRHQRESHSAERVIRLGAGCGVIGDAGRGRVRVHDELSERAADDAAFRY